MKQVAQESLRFQNPRLSSLCPPWLGWCLAGLAIVVTGAVSAAPAPVRVGIVFPLTGGSADFGLSAERGAQFAVDEINAVGGYLGRPLELVVRDDSGDPAKGRTAAQELIETEKVVATIGYCNTGVALNALDVFEKHHHVLIVPCAQGTAITSRTPASTSFVFRVAPSDTMNAAFLVHEIVASRKLERVAILADTTGYGNGGVADITAELKRRQLEPVYVGRFAASATSLKSELAQARSSGAQALVVYTVGPGQALAAKERSAMKWDVPYFATWTLSFHSVLADAGAQALEGTMMTQSFIQDAANESRASFLLRYAKGAKGANASLMAAAQAYDSVHLLLRSMFTSHGDFSGDALKQALENPTEPYRGVVTTYVRPFSPEDHEAFSLNMIWMGVWRSGEIQYLYAKDARLSAEVRRKSSL